MIGAEVARFVRALVPPPGLSDQPESCVVPPGVMPGESRSTGAPVAAIDNDDACTDVLDRAVRGIAGGLHQLGL